MCWFFYFTKMKKKLIISAAVICSLITILWIVNLFTGMLQYYKIPIPSSEPNIKQGEKVFVSNLKDPAPYKFIVFTSKYEDSINMVFMPDYKPGSRYIHRLCSIPGDVIEMKNGILFVNNRNFDSGLNLNKSYKITNTEFYSIEQDDIIAGETAGSMQMISNNTAIVTFDTVLLKKYASKINPLQYIMPISQNGCFKWNNKDHIWSADNFGPLKIPADCYFVLGDNRHNALDSRYIGYVKKENILGVVLNK